MFQIRTGGEAQLWPGAQRPPATSQLWGLFVGGVSFACLRPSFLLQEMVIVMVLSRRVVMMIKGPPVHSRQDEQ